MMWAPAFKVEVTTVFNAKFAASGSDFGHTQVVTEVEKAMGLTSIPCATEKNADDCDSCEGCQNMSSIEKKENFRLP
jgi:hypothetical protein